MRRRSSPATGSSSHHTSNCPHCHRIDRNKSLDSCNRPDTWWRFLHSHTCHCRNERHNPARIRRSLRADRRSHRHSWHKFRTLNRRRSSNQARRCRRDHTSSTSSFHRIGPHRTRRLGAHCRCHTRHTHPGNNPGTAHNPVSNSILTRLVRHTFLHNRSRSGSPGDKSPSSPHNHTRCSHTKSHNRRGNCTSRPPRRAHCHIHQRRSHRSHTRPDNISLFADSRAHKSSPGPDHHTGPHTSWDRHSPRCTRPGPPHNRTRHFHTKRHSRTHNCTLRPIHTCHPHTRGRKCHKVSTHLDNNP
jgi:hypothetical protein